MIITSVRTVRNLPTTCWKLSVITRLINLACCDYPIIRTMCTVRRDGGLLLLAFNSIVCSSLVCCLPLSLVRRRLLFRVVWCLVSGVWFLVSGIWCPVSDVWWLVFCVWCLVSGIWCLVSCVWCLVHSDVWCLMSGVWFCCLSSVVCLMFCVWCMFSRAVWYLVSSGI